MSKLREALEAFLDLEHALALARVEDHDDFDDRWEASESWFAAGQPIVFDDSPWFGDADTGRAQTARRKVFQLTTHEHPELGNALIAHVSYPKTSSTAYESRIAFADVDGTARVVGVYTRCSQCFGKGCNNEDPDEGDCQKTGWLHARGVRAPASFGPSTSKTDLAAPFGDWSTDQLANN